MGHANLILPLGITAALIGCAIFCWQSFHEQAIGNNWSGNYISDALESFLSYSGFTAIGCGLIGSHTSLTVALLIIVMTPVVAVLIHLLILHASFKWRRRQRPMK